MQTVTKKIKMPAREARRLDMLALDLGFSAGELLAHIMRNLKPAVPLESVSDYTKPTLVKGSLKRALADYGADRISESLT